MTRHNEESSGTTVTVTRIARTIGVVATGGLLMAAIAAPSAAFGMQPTPDRPATIRPAAEERPADGTPTDEVDPTPGPTDLEENIVYDGPFITPTPDPTPVGRVRGATGTPGLTPPATDSTGGSDPGSTPGAGLGLLLLAVGGLSTLGLTLGRVPAARRS